MSARRIVAVSPDRAFGQTLGAALQAVAGTVEVHVALDALGWGDPATALYVIHLEGELARPPGELLPRLAGNGPVIAVLPRSDVAAVVELMQASERVAGVVTAEDFDPGQLAAVAARVLTDDVFGLEKVMAPGTQIHTRVVGDYREKTLCMAAIAEFVDGASVPRTYRTPIEQCIDEMLMNALYDAPVDAQGQRLFSGVPTKVRITWRTDQRVTVQYACDGKRFAVSVRDAFGTLERQTALGFLHKGLHAAEQVDRRAGGAGLGLYLMVNSSSAVYFHALPGIATEAICVFDLEAGKPGLERFAFLVQADPAGQRPTRPARRLPAGSRARGRVLAAVIAATVVLVGALVGGVVLPRIHRGAERAQVTFTTHPAGATLEISGRAVGIAVDGTYTVGDLEPGRDYPVVARLDGYEAKQAVVRPHVGGNEVLLELQALATVELDSQPAGAAVEIDGKPMGSTPLTLTSLTPGATVSIVFRRTGYHAATARLQVPAMGERKRLVQPLTVSDEFVRVHFVSNPPGAEIMKSGQPQGIDRTYTPADVFVEAGEVQRFTLRMPRHVPLVIEPFTPARGAAGLEKGGDLVEGATLHVEATLDGKVSVSGAPHCQDAALPLDCTLAPGTYVVEYTGPDSARITRTVTMPAQDLREKLELGVVEAGPGKLLSPGGVHRAVFEVGTHEVTVSDQTGTHKVTVSVKPGATTVAN